MSYKIITPSCKKGQSQFTLSNGHILTIITDYDGSSCYTQETLSGIITKCAIQRDNELIVYTEPMSMKTEKKNGVIKTVMSSGSLCIFHRKIGSNQLPQILEKTYNDSSTASNFDKKKRILVILGVISLVIAYNFKHL